MGSMQGIDLLSVIKRIDCSGKQVSLGTFTRDETARDLQGRRIQRHAHQRAGHLAMAISDR